MTALDAIGLLSVGVDEGQFERGARVVADRNNVFRFVDKTTMRVRHSILAAAKDPAPGPKGLGSAAAAPAAATGGSWFSSLMNGPQGKAVAKFSNVVKEKIGKMKMAMPVDVKVDFLKPTMETIRESAHNVWVQLPPQAQVAAPYVATAFGTFVVVNIIQQRRVNYYRSKRDALLIEDKQLQREKDDFRYKVGVRKAGGGIPRSEMEVKLAAAISEATNAAAAAAGAPASAATSCVVKR